MLLTSRMMLCQSQLPQYNTQDTPTPLVLHSVQEDLLRIGITPNSPKMSDLEFLLGTGLDCNYQKPREQPNLTPSNHKNIPEPLFEPYNVLSDFHFLFITFLLQTGFSYSQQSASISSFTSRRFSWKIALHRIFFLLITISEESESGCGRFLVYIYVL